MKQWEYELLARRNPSIRRHVVFLLVLLAFWQGVSCFGNLLAKTQATTSTVVAVPRQAQPLTTGALIIQNNSPFQIVTLRISTSRTPDLSTFDSILLEVQRRAAEQTTVALAHSAYNLVSEFRPYNWISAKPTEEVFDPVKLFNVYGYGLCDAAARALATILWGLQIRAQVWDLRVHVVAEFFDGKHWQGLDPDMRVHAYVGTTSRTLPARYYWGFRQKLQPAEVSDPNMAQMLRKQLVSALDQVTSPPQRAYWRPFSAHDAGLRLRPGEQVIRYSDSRLGYYATLSTEPPPLYANAVFRWERELPAEIPSDDDLDDMAIRSRFPFVIVGGTIHITSLEAGVPPPVPWVITGNGDYERCPLISTAENAFESSATYELPPAIIGRYDFTVRLCGEDLFSCNNLPRVRYEQTVITQCSSSTFPAIPEGEGDELVRVETSDNALFDMTLLYRTGDDLPDDFSVLTE
ncbi:MAG: hypothetical protein ACP5QZ_07935 [Candidatus Sumerlaeaceae bacterium]